MEKNTKLTELLDVNYASDIEAIEDLRKNYTKAIDEFKKQVDEVNEMDDLKSLENDIMEAMDVHDKHIKETSYELPEEVTFEDEKFTRAKIATKIKTLLERNEIEFTYIYGLYNLCKFWASNPSTISYGTLDSTLRLLEQPKYGGKDWRTMLVINEFFQKGNHEYNRDLSRTLLLAELHNAVISRMQLISPLNGDESESADENPA